jgi:Phage capsid family
MNRPDRIPFAATRTDQKPRDTLWHTVNAVCKGFALKRPAEEFLKDDAPGVMLYRASVNPAQIGSGGWANALAATAVEDAIVGLAGPSAAGSIMAMGTRLDFQGRASISVPSAIISGTDAGGFIAEGAPIPVRKRSVSGSLTLSPFRFMVLTEFSNEAAKYSDFDRVNKADVTKAAALALDVAMFSNTAGSASRPPGLFVGAPALTATAAGSEAMEKDIAQLVAGLNTAGGGAAPVFICSPPQAATLRLRAGPQFNYPILASGALANGSIACLDISAFVSAFNGVPEFDVSDQGAFQEEDTSPASGFLTASPVRSQWQTNSSALRLCLWCAWGVRGSASGTLVQTISSVNW